MGFMPLALSVSTMMNVSMMLGTLSMTEEAGEGLFKSNTADFKSNRLSVKDSNTAVE